MSGERDHNVSGPDDGGPRSLLVTGAAGFVGSHVCDRLLRAGHHVWGVDSFDDAYAPDLKRRNLSDALPSARMHLVEGDVRDSVLMDGLFADVEFDAVVHLAARHGTQASVEAPRLVFETNVMGTLDLLETLRRHGVDSLVLGSSTAVRGEDNPLPANSDGAADHPISPLAVSNWTAEKIARSYHDMYGISVHALRFPSAYGPRQRPDLPLHRYARLTAQGRPVPIPDDEVPRSVVYVADVAEGVAHSLDALWSETDGPAVFEAVELYPPECHPLRDLVTQLADALGLEANIEEDPSLTGEITRCCDACSPDRAEELLGFRPDTRLDEGFRRFAEWFWVQGDVDADTVEEIRAREAQEA